MPRKKTTAKTASKKTAARSKPRRKTATKKITMVHAENYSNEIREKAYELYSERGYNHGNDMDDWLKAENIVKEKLSMVK